MMSTLDHTTTSIPPGSSRRGHVQPRKPGSRLVAVLYGVFPFLAAAGIVFVLAIIGGKAVQGYELKQEAKALQHSIDQLKTANRGLSETLQYYKSDEYIEKVAREELGLVRPGDVPIVIASPNDSSQSSPYAPTPKPDATPTRPKAPTWQRWLSVFVDQE